VVVGWVQSASVQDGVLVGLGGADRRDRLGEPGLFAFGAVIGVLNGRGGLRSRMRQLLIDGGAALLVYLIGRGVGALTGVQLGA
jgi:hypothetical protein